MASEDVYKHLWIPKRTAKDWGKTEYKIIRNWTPRVPQPASHHSHQSPGHSAASTHDILDDIGNHEEEDNTGEELQAEETVSSWRSLQRASERAAGNQTDTERMEDDFQLAQSVVGTKRALSSRGGSESVAKRTRLSNTVSFDSDEGDTGEEVEGGEGGAEPVRLGGKSSEMREDSETWSDDEPEEIQTREKRVTRGKGKRAASKTSSFTLWQSHYQRSARDLNELDICLSIYDSAMRDAINGTSDTIVQGAMIRHWKLTKKHILSTIRDLSVVSGLEKKYRQELKKHRELQQESMSTLKTLREVNAHYLQTAYRARQAHKLSVEQSEVKELSHKISSCVARLNSHL